MECNGIRRSETYAVHQIIDKTHHHNCFTVSSNAFVLAVQFGSRGSRANEVQYRNAPWRSGVFSGGVECSGKRVWFYLYLWQCVFS
jgi:hypothetical protein